MPVPHRAPFARTGGIRTSVSQPDRSGGGFRPQRRSVPRTFGPGLRIRRDRYGHAPTPGRQSPTPHLPAARRPGDHQPFGPQQQGVVQGHRPAPPPARPLIIGGNIGKNTLTQPSQVAADYLKMFRNLYQYVDYFSINVCCDNCADGSVSHNKAHLMNILQPLFDFRRGQNQYRPILLKISPDLPGPAYRRSDPT